MSVTNLWGQLKTAAAAGILAGGRPYARNFLYVGTNAPTFATTYATVALALAALVSDDVLMLGPQVFDEGNLTLPATASGVTIVGCGPRGSCSITPSTAGQSGLNVLAADVTIVNVNIAGNATGAYALKVGDTGVDVFRFRAYECKFSGVTAVSPGCAVLLNGANDSIFDGCEFASCSNAILFKDNTTGVTKKTRIQNCLFENYTTVALGVISTGVAVDLWVQNNIFARQSDGSSPTDFILLSDNANIGFIAGNFFANATNATGVLTIGTGLLWGPNGTEAGWSTARPA